MEHPVKATSPAAAHPESKGDAASALGCLMRLTWLLGGNIVLGALTLNKLEQPPWTFTPGDLLFWLLVAAVVGVRYVDVKRFGGTTVSAAPATNRHVARYAVRFVAIWTLVWLAAQSIQYA